MSDSLLIYVDRGDNVHVMDRDALRHFDEPPPLMLAAIALINAGFSGVYFYEQFMSDGRCVQAIEVNDESPEGRAMRWLSELQAAGESLPEPSFVLDVVRHEYARRAEEEPDYE